MIETNECLVTKSVDKCDNKHHNIGACPDTKWFPISDRENVFVCTGSNKKFYTVTWFGGPAEVNVGWHCKCFTQQNRTQRNSLRVLYHTVGKLGG